MSYNLRIQLDEHGEPQVTEYTGSLHGPLSIHGHEDSTSASVQVTRLNEHGSTVIQAAAFNTTGS